MSSLRPDRNPLGDDAALTAGPFLRALLVALLGLSTALLIAAVSARQVSNRGSALPLLQASVEALTDPEALATANLESMRSMAYDDPHSPVRLPAFPVDVLLTPQEARTLQSPEIADLVTQRAAARIYEDGMGALDQTGRRDDGLFSAQGLVRRMNDRLTRDAHAAAGRAAVALLIVVAGLSVVIVLAYRDDRRLRALGIGVLAGSLAGLTVCLLARFIAGRAGSNDPFVEDVRDIAREILAVPTRNFLVVTALGGVLTAASLALRLWPGRSLAAASTEDFDPPSDHPH